MSLAISKTRSVLGIYAQSVSVEVHLSNGLPGFTIVGLAETAVKESKDRVRSAIINSQFEFPCRKITVNLAPANLPKSGSGFDLPIAIGILAASEQIPAHWLGRHEFIAELALNGELRGVSAIIPVVIAAHQAKQQLIIARANADEAAIAKPSTVYCAESLREVCDYLFGQHHLSSVSPINTVTSSQDSADWSDVKGQHHAKRAMEIAAFGGHSILLSGPPGSGKTMLAKRFNCLLPDLEENEALESLAIHSISGRLPNFNQWRRPAFRSPHHTASTAALVGGGNPPKPGEISLAHRGVLFLDELPEFHRHVLETLREPLEAGSICISRAAFQSEFPADFQLIAAMNPCPCGHWGNTEANCLCSPERISRYLAKLSGPLLDRIDLQVNIQALSTSELIKPSCQSNETEALKQKITLIRALQFARQNCLNARLEAKKLEEVCHLGSKEREFLSQVIPKLKLSARAYNRLLKVGRTIADIEGHDRVTVEAVKQALSFKQSLQMPR